MALSSRKTNNRVFKFATSDMCFVFHVFGTLPMVSSSTKLAIGKQKLIRRQQHKFMAGTSNSSVIPVLGGDPSPGNAPRCAVHGGRKFLDDRFQNSVAKQVVLEGFWE